MPGLMRSLLLLIALSPRRNYRRWFSLRLREVGVACSNQPDPVGTTGGRKETMKLTGRLHREAGRAQVGRLAPSMRGALSIL